ncbi:enoyl-CoA hydratase [Streptomyces sp. NPDC058657]|uniref:enoyl-CoA hydratase n=1 Tax=unclassified Streptomyces TaxID=2593676 RepID=UPI003658F1E9
MATEPPGTPESPVTPGTPRTPRTPGTPETPAPPSTPDASAPQGAPAPEPEPVLYERRGPVAYVTLNRPRYRNAQNSAMTYALDTAFYRAAEDSEVRVVVLAGAGEHFSAGHDIGSPGRDAHLPFARRAGLWWDHSDKAGAESRLARESEVYLGMCRRWRELPKPVVASVQGACVAGGLMLAWVCDVIVAAEDAFFADPVVRMGIPGVEYFAHPWVMPPRIAREFLFTGDRMSARRAYEVGMVNRVVARAELESCTQQLAERIAEMPRLGLALAKRAVNQAEDLQGLHAGLDSVFGLHHLAHAHNAETAEDSLGGMDVAAMKKKAGN